MKKGVKIRWTLFKIFVFFLFFVNEGVVETWGLVASSPVTAKCVPYDRSDLVEPCQSANPSTFAYLVNNASLWQEINNTNAQMTAISSFAPGTVCHTYFAYFCQNPGLLSHRVPMANCPVDALGRPPAVAFAAPTCRDLCQRMREACYPVLASAGLGDYLPPSYCDGLPTTGVEVDGLFYPCWNFTPGANQTAGLLNCPPETELVKGRCVPRCPSPEYSSQQISQLEILQQVTAWISIFFVLLYSLAWILTPMAHQFPRRIVFILMASTLPLSLAFVLATFSGGHVKPVWCGDRDWYSSRLIGSQSNRCIHNDGLCAFQGILIQFGTLSTTFWWAILASHTLYQLVQRISWSQSQHSYWLEALYYFIGFGMPLITVIIAAVCGKFCYETSATFCWLSSERNEVWRISLWFVPTGIGLTIGASASVGCVVKLIMLLRTREKTRPMILKLVVAFLTLVIADTFIFASAIYSSSELPSNTLDIIMYLICLVRADGGCRSALDKTDFSIQFQLSMAACFFMCSMGSLLFCCFGIPTIWNSICHRKLPLLSVSRDGSGSTPIPPSFSGGSISSFASRDEL